MPVTAWSNGGTGYGIRVGVSNRECYFRREWSDVTIEIDGAPKIFKLTGSFWRTCPEIRGGAIRDWLTKNDLLPWPKGHPPALELIPVEGRRFRLTMGKRA